MKKIKPLYILIILVVLILLILGIKWMRCKNKQNDTLSKARYTSPQGLVDAAKPCKFFSIY